MPNGAPGRPDAGTLPAAAEPGEAQLTAELLDLERSIAGCASRDQRPAAGESTERFRRGTPGMLFEKLRDLIAGQKSGRR
jgi:hypothetical protein